VSDESTASHAWGEAAIESLRLAAEDVAWLTGRGYPLGSVSDLVAAHRGLTEQHRAALARGTCSEPQYRRRAARELEAEDIARRPLAIDAVDVVATIEAAFGGDPILQTLDGTMRAFGVEPSTYTPGADAADAVGRVIAVLQALRPSVLKFVVDERAPGAAALRGILEEQAKSRKVKAEIVLAPDAAKALRKERQIVTGDADTLDVCAGWFNLVARVVEGIPTARVIRLQ
jgi:hypothetical protein